MSVELKVPEVGESITEVEIGEWLKSEGESAKRDETVVMIETDKVTVELPAPVSGMVTKILVDKGQSASVGDVIGYMEEGTSQSTTSRQDAGARAKPESREAAPDPSPAEPRAESEPPRSRDDRGRDTTSSQPGTSNERVMPAAKRALSEAGISAREVEAKGPGGRLLKEDVQRQVARGAAGAAPSKPARSHGIREEEAVAMSPMRRRIAERLVEAQQSAALLTTFNEADMSGVMELRKQYQPIFLEKYGIKLGFMSFFVKAAVDALKQIPQVNAEIRGTDIVYRNYFDIGVAVGGGRGLVVPIIRNAERLSFADVERTITDLGTRAKNNSIKLDELQGGTFTISNGGVYGSMMSTPIINPPQSGILGLHAIQDRPVAKDGHVVIRPMMYLALTYDHRVVDGREAVTFLKRIKEAVEEPARMLLEV